MPVEADSVADAAREGFERRTVRPHPVDRGVHGLGLADVARRAHRDVEQTVRSEGDELPAVVAVLRELADDDGLGRIREARLDPVVTEHAVHLRHVERAVAEGDAVRHVQAARDAHDLSGAAGRIAHGEDRAPLTVADEERPGRTHRHRPRVRDAGVEADLETGRELDLVERQRPVGPRRERTGGGRPNKSEGGEGSPPPNEKFRLLHRPRLSVRSVFRQFPSSGQVEQPLDAAHDLRPVGVRP